MSRQPTDKIRMAGWAEIPLSLVRDPVHMDYRVQRDLIFRTQDTREFTGASKDSRETVTVYAIEDGMLYVPRYYFDQIRPYLDEPRVVLTSAMVDGYTDMPKFKGTLIEEPGKNQKEGSRALQSAEGGILVAAPGKGKTVMGIHAACAMSRRTLVVVPTQALMEQWIDRILQFTNARPEHIGVVQGETCQWNRPFIVGMVHSLSQRDYPKQLYGTVGNLITDEVHRIGAPTWLQVVPKFPAAIRWGLSATPERSDGMHAAFMLHIGGVVYEMLDLDVRPTVYQILTGHTPESRMVTNRWNGQLNFSRLYTALSLNYERNNLIAREVKNCWKAGRKQLILSKRILHLSALYHLSLEKGVPPDQMGVIAGAEKTPGDRRRILENRKVIFAIEQIAGLGLDQPDLDTLHYALPSQAVEQTMGRIEREHDGKKFPLAFDYVDEFGMLHRLAKSRAKKYHHRGYKVLVVDRRK